MTWWQTLTSRFRDWIGRLRSAVSRITAAVRAAGTAVRQAAGDAAQRHLERADEDTAYARTIATAVSELVATMVPRPTLATTLAVALARLLGGHDDRRQPSHPSRQRGTYGGHDAGTAVPPAVPGSLWDRLQ